MLMMAHSESEIMTPSSCVRLSGHVSKGEERRRETESDKVLFLTLAH